MATLTGSTIASSYDQLLALPSGGGDGTTLVALTDGDGEYTFALQVSTAGIKSTGTLNVAGITTATGGVVGDVTGDLTGNVTASSVLANGVTATTQSAGDDSTKVATTAYVDAQVETSDTLAEVLANGNTTGSTNIIVSASQSITTDTISETTSDAGVTIESVLVKDNSVTATTFTGALTGNASTVTTNANLTGEVTSSGNAATIANDVVDEANLKVDNSPTNDYVLTAKSSASGGLTWSSVGTGTVTSVSGAGTVNGLTLTGTVTSSGSLTLGGTLASVANSALTNSAVTVGTTAISLGASSTTLAGLTSVTSTAFAGALTGNVTGDVSGSSGSCTGNAATVTTNANLTGDVTSSGNATTIATDAVDIAMLSATGTASASTFLRGDNAWATPAGGSPSGTAGAIQFSDGSAFDSDVSDLFWDNSNKRLGVGTNAPSSRGQLHVHNATDNTRAAIQLTSNETGLGASDGFYIVVSPYGEDDLSCGLVNTEAAPMYFDTSNARQMTLTKDGDLAIGADHMTPYRKLDVQYSDSDTDVTSGPGATDGRGLMIRNTDGTDNTYAQLDLSTGSAGDARIAAIDGGSNYTDLAFVTDAGGSGFTEKFRITSRGEIKNHGVVTTAGYIGGTMSVTTKTTNEASSDITENGQDQLYIVNIPTLNQNYTVNIPGAATVPAGRKLIICPIDVQYMTNGDYFYVTAASGTIITQYDILAGNTSTDTVYAASDNVGGEGFQSITLISDGAANWISPDVSYTDYYTAD